MASDNVQNWTGTPEIMLSNLVGEFSLGFVVVMLAIFEVLAPVCTSAIVALHDPSFGM
jgi:hypothetical protein